MEEFNKIQDYLLNRMSPSERESFENDVANNSELSMNLELQRFELETIDQLEEDALREKLTKLNINAINSGSNTITRDLPTNNKRNIQRFLWLAAASIFFIIGILQFQNVNNSSIMSTAEVYSKTRIHYDITGARGNANEVAIFDPAIVHILEERDNHQADKAVDYFSKFESAKGSEELKAKINLAHSYILKGDFNKAIKTFEALITNSNLSSRDKEEVEFFIAYLKYKNDDKEGKQLLIKIAEQGYRFSPLAKNIIDN